MQQTIEWKSSNITPDQKIQKGSKTEKSNSRNVSILTTFSKVFEKNIYDQMYAAIVSLLSHNLSGFLKGHSSSTAILKTTKDWCASLEVASLLLLLQWTAKQLITATNLIYEYLQKHIIPKRITLSQCWGVLGNLSKFTS